MSNCTHARTLFCAICFLSDNSVITVWDAALLQSLSEVVVIFTHNTCSSKQGFLYKLHIFIILLHAHLICWSIIWWLDTVWEKGGKKSVYPPGEVNWQVLGLAKRILIFSVTDVALRAWVVLLVSDLFNLQAQLVSDPLSSSELRCWAIL